MKKILKSVVSFILATEARLLLRKHKPKIIAVTGNVGKTSTKDAIYEILSAHKVLVRKSKKSYNSEFGIPLTILALPNAWNSLFAWVLNIFLGVKRLFEKDYPDYLVLEVGADHPGDIKKITKWLKADIVVLTAIPDPPVHIEFFKNSEELKKEKEYLLKLALEHKGEVSLVYDLDSEHSKDLADRNDFYKKISYSFTRDSDIYLKHYRVDCKEKNGELFASSEFELMIDGFDESIMLSVKNKLGKHQSKPYMAAIAVAKLLNLKLDKKLELENKTPGRMSFIPGLRGAYLIDDSYNSSFSATMAALDTLSEFKCAENKVAILGDMLELGKFSSETHAKILREAVKVAGRVYVMGARFKESARSIESDKVCIYDKSDFEKLCQDLKKSLNKNSVFLIKGSQSMRMENVVKCLMLRPEEAKKKLVRQEPEWLAR